MNEQIIEMAQSNALLAVRVALVGKLSSDEIDAVLVEAEAMLKRAKAAN